MDSGSVISEHEADSGVGSMNSLEPLMYLSITIPDLSIQKFLQFNPDESVWTAKQQILLSVAKGLRERFNYGLFIPPANGKAGKFLDDGRLLKEYSLTTTFSSLELIMKRRIYKHVMAPEKKMKQLHSKSSLKQFLEWIRKGDVDKVIKVTNQGLDPNFIDPESGETPLSLSVSTEHPARMTLSLVGGGAHLDYRNSKGLTPMHVAAIQGKEEAIKGLLDLGSSTNYYDLQGLTPVYHCVCNNSFTRCLEMLLYDYAILGATDESQWTELHQACKWGRVQHLELMIYYGANLNAQNSGGNTPLHICAVNNQEDCARVILFRGADKTIKNFANHDAFETAIISGNIVLAEIIRDFSQEEVVPYQDVPKYNEKRRTRIQSDTSGIASMQRWQSNPQLHRLFGDDQLSIRTTKIKNDYDLTLPRNMPVNQTGRLNRWPSDVPLVSEVSGVKLNQPRFHGNSAQRKQQYSGLPLPRTVFLKPGKNGYGFILRGSRGSADDSNFIPTPEVPALQYFSIIAENSMAEQAGIRPRDFLLEVNGQNVRTASHDFTVNLIKQTKDILCLVVVTPAEESMVPQVKALHELESSQQSVLHHQTSVFDGISQVNKTNGGLADLENLERMIHESDYGENGSGMRLKRLLIAPNMKTLERMARLVGSGVNIASVHTRHGKQMAMAMPLGDTYQDSIGLCRSRVAPSPNEGSQTGNLWKANSMQNLVSPGVTISEDQRDMTIQTPRKFIPKEQALPFTRMISLPCSESDDIKDLQGSLDTNFSRQEQKPVLKEMNVAPHPSNSPSQLLSPPPLPPKTGSSNLVSSLDSSKETKVSVGVAVLNASKMSKTVLPFSLPPPPPPPPPPSLQRPVPQNSTTPLNASKILQNASKIPQFSAHVQPVLNDIVLQNDKKVASFHHSAISSAALNNSAAQGASTIPHLTSGAPTPPLPPLRPLLNPVAPFSTKPLTASQQSTLKEEPSSKRSVTTQNSLLEEIQRKREILTQKDSGFSSRKDESWTSINVSGQQSQKLPSQTMATVSTSSSDASLLLEIQMQKKHMEDKAVEENHIYAELAENQMETTEASSSNSQQPFLQDLLKALSNRPKPTNETAAVPGTVTSGAPDTMINGKHLCFATRNVSQGLPLASHATGTLGEENIPVQLVNSQPVHHGYQHSPSVIPPRLVPPPAPPKFNSKVPPREHKSFLEVGKTQKSFQQSNSIDDLEFDLPPPPPPPAPTFDDFNEDYDLDETPLPLPPPPEEFD